MPKRNHSIKIDKCQKEKVNISFLLIKKKFKYWLNSNFEAKKIEWNFVYLAFSSCMLLAEVQDKLGLSLELLIIHLSTRN